MQTRLLYTEEDSSCINIGWVLLYFFIGSINLEVQKISFYTLLTIGNLFNPAEPLCLTLNTLRLQPFNVYMWVCLSSICSHMKILGLTSFTGRLNL